jgi:hypothetical protein
MSKLGQPLCARIFRQGASIRESIYVTYSKIDLSVLVRDSDTTWRFRRKLYKNARTIKIAIDSLK